MNAQVDKPGELPVAKLLVQAGLILALVVALGVVAVCIGHFAMGGDLQVGLLAILVCSVSAGLAHVAGAYPRGIEFVLMRMSIGMAVRTAPPFLLAVWALYFAVPPLEKSLVLYIILLYIVGLLADVHFTVKHLKNG